MAPAIPTSARRAHPRRLALGLHSSLSRAAPSGAYATAPLRAVGPDQPTVMLAPQQPEPLETFADLSAALDVAPASAAFLANHAPHRVVAPMWAGVRAETERERP